VERLELSSLPVGRIQFDQVAHLKLKITSPLVTSRSSKGTRINNLNLLASRVLAMPLLEYLDKREGGYRGSITMCHAITRKIHFRQPGLSLSGDLTLADVPDGAKKEKQSCQ